MIDSTQNPFTVQTPEGIKAEDVISLFVDVFTDFHNVPKPGHAFLNGSRGSGKSMMFRYLQPDCQLLARQIPISKHPFFAIYVPIKQTTLQITELARLENKHAAFLLNEHLLTMYIAINCFTSLMQVTTEGDHEETLPAVRNLYLKTFTKLLCDSGWNLDSPTLESNDRLKDVFEKMKASCMAVYKAGCNYVRRLAWNAMVTYEGALCNYFDFLLPLMCEIKKLPFMPRGPIFLLLDDADNLSHTQTMILNTWVSSRTSSDISLKISTQLNYKTYQTTLGVTIDAPHDYSEVNISAVYTSAKNHYNQRVREIVRKRLLRWEIDVTPEEFFPQDEEQESQIRVIGEKIRDEFDLHGRGHKPSDDVLRYARPTYIASLKGSRKSGSTYSYSGFNQLVHISDGVVRYFLEPASFMYTAMLTKEQVKGNTGVVKYIDPGTQDKIVREAADRYLFEEFEKLYREEESDKVSPNKAKKLRNLIVALGSGFHDILISDRSERRVFSIAFSDTPDKEILEVLRLGIRYGYFHESAIGRKDGLGRTRLYILSRRLAPYFLLDPNGFAGYKFVTSEAIKEALYSPDAFTTRIKTRGYQTVFENPQQNLFSED